LAGVACHASHFVKKERKMAKRLQYDIDSEKLRGMGLNPEKMTLRERHEALNGPVGGKSIIEIIERAHGVKFERKSDDSHAKNDDSGAIVRMENIQVVKVPKFEHKNTESRPKMSPEDILRALGAGDEAFRILKGKSASRDGEMAYEQPKLLDVTPLETKNTTKRCSNGRARPVSRPVQLSLTQGYLHEVLETA
jgi:hypothetical protein